MQLRFVIMNGILYIYPIKKDKRLISLKSAFANRKLIVIYLLIYFFQ